MTVSLYTTKERVILTVIRRTKPKAANRRGHWEFDLDHIIAAYYGDAHPKNSRSTMATVLRNLCLKSRIDGGYKLSRVSGIGRGAKGLYRYEAWQ